MNELCVGCGARWGWWFGAQAACAMIVAEMGYADNHSFFGAPIRCNTYQKHGNTYYEIKNTEKCL